MIDNAVIEKYIALFNRGAFFEAHEVLEEIWKRTEGADRNVLQGLIQIAAAMVHFQRGNRVGAEELLRKTPVQQLKDLESWRGIRAAQLLRDVVGCLNGSCRGLQIDFEK